MEPFLFTHPQDNIMYILSTNQVAHMMTTNHTQSFSFPTRRAAGFSLVELMIVIVIIGVLAAIAVPIYSSSVQKAKRSEADAALGSIRKELQAYYGEHGRIPKQQQADYVIGASWNDIRAGELNGKYFSDSSYTYTGSPNNKTWKIICAKGSVLDYDRILDHTGSLKNE